MPLYTYKCTTCGETLEILHGVDKLKTRCGLDCKLREPGTFGKGAIDKLIDAPPVNLSRPQSTNSREARRAEARRLAALGRAGGPLSEKELDKLKKGGMSVYRKESEGRWERDGGAGDDGAPARIIKPEEP